MSFVTSFIDKPWGHYAKWSESDRKRQILYDFIYTWNLKTKPNTKTKSKSIDLKSPQQQQQQKKVFVTMCGDGW